MFPLRDDVPCQRTPVVTWALIALNLVAFAWQLQFQDLAIFRGGAIPFELLTLEDVFPRDLVPPPFTILTSMFLHGSLLHVGGNMLFLWIFGNNVEDALGRIRFTLFYLAAGVAAALVQTLATAVKVAALPAAEAGLQLSVPMVGASGAIAGVLAAYLVLHPRARVQVLLLVFIVRLPAVVFIGGWFLLQLLAAVRGSTSAVAYSAHVGGFLAGLALIWRLGRRPGWRRSG